MASGIVDRLKQALQSVYVVSAPDHPATGGNTGDQKWPPEDEETEPTDDSQS
jgi:hypothetical protein